MRLRPAVPGDEALLERAFADLGRRGFRGWAEAVADGAMSAWVAEAARGARGVVLLTVLRVGRAERELRLTAGWAEVATLGAERRAFMRCLGQLAMRMGCRGVSFTSSRRGWQRVARSYGFRPAATVYAWGGDAHGG